MNEHPRGVGRLSVLIVAFVLLSSMACDRGGPTSGAEADRPEWCPPGEGVLVRGRLLVPRTGSVADGGDERIRTERPASGRRVRVYRHARPDRTIATDESDAKGRWCVRIPEEPSLGVELIAEAKWKGVGLRRSLVSNSRQTISFRSEALHRVLEARDGGLSEMPEAVYLNLQAIASSSLDLMASIRRRPEESPDQFLERARRALVDVPRFKKRLSW